MALQISRVRIAVSTTTDRGTKVFDPIERTNSTKESIESNKENIRKQLLDIAKAENVCGFVVGWPLEPSGTPGSRCGQVLNLLDYFAETRQDGGYLINKHARPVVLLDERMFTHGHFDEERDPVDEWGRCRVFGKKFPLPSKDESGNEKKYTFKTSLRSDHPVSEDSTSASLILEHFATKHNITEPNSFNETVENIENSSCEAENIDEMYLEQMIESFEETSNHMKSLPL